MVFEFLKLNIDITDYDFNAIYPEKVSNLARKHWSSVSVSKLASEFLVDRPGTKVLDIGSGAGKFCMIGATNTKGHFTGVEQRHELAELSTRIAQSYQIHNAKFIHANITSINFSDYDAFYFYNSFYENIDRVNKIDDTVILDIKLYHLYSVHIVEQFASLPLGARLVTYCSPLNIIPQTFKLQDSSNGGLLKFWEKVSAGKDHPISEN
ncbi:MAG: SAM-dependent methyltransferase [Marivirga sp.]|nr:SAM-dependent methyltransferase [Marivirga sp.]